MTKHIDQVETNVPYYDHDQERILVPRVQTARDTVFDIPSQRLDDGDVDQMTLPTDAVVERIGDGLEQLAVEELRDLASTEELTYFRRRDRYDLDVVDGARSDYEALAHRLNRFDHVAAEVETEKSFSPNLKVRAYRKYGATTDVLHVLGDEFDLDEIIAAVPIEPRDGELAVMYRASYGGQ